MWRSEGPKVMFRVWKMGHLATYARALWLWWSLVCWISAAIHKKWCRRKHFVQSLHATGENLPHNISQLLQYIYIYTHSCLHTIIHIYMYVSLYIYVYIYTIYHAMLKFWWKGHFSYVPARLPQPWGLGRWGSQLRPLAIGTALVEMG